MTEPTYGTGRTLGVRFACPQCKGDLVTIDDGEHMGTGLECSTHGLFERRGGVWRFLRENHTEFDHHWTATAARTIPAEKVAAACRFLTPLFATFEEESQKGVRTVLDAGCGDGVHLSALAGVVPADVQLIGLDVSLGALGALDALGERSLVRVHGNLLALPFASESLDVTFAYGSIAYSGNITLALDELVRVLRPGGLLGLWFMPTPRGLLGAVFRGVRQVTSRLPRWLQARCADLLVPLLPVLPTRSGVTLGNASWRECREVVLVNITPRILEFPTVERVANDLAERGCHVGVPGSDDGAEFGSGVIWVRREL